MIETEPPKTWQALQTRCASILCECGLQSETNRKLKLARGAVSVDVYALDPKAILPSSWIIECKYWRRRVPQHVVHSLRSVVADAGASHGFILSIAGFQKGAVEAARHTNVRLFKYTEFESFFEPVWTDNYLRPKLYTEVDPLIEYTEPINSRIFRKADGLPESKRRAFADLRKQYEPLAMLAAFMVLRCVSTAVARMPWVAAATGPLKLPFAPLGNEDYAEGFPTELRTTLSARRFLDLYCLEIRSALRKFDDVFGERA